MYLQGLIAQSKGHLPTRPHTHNQHIIMEPIHFPLISQSQQRQTLDIIIPFITISFIDIQGNIELSEHSAAKRPVSRAAQSPTSGLVSPPSGVSVWC